MFSPESSNVLSFGTFYVLQTCKISKIYLQSFQYTGYYLCINQRECVSTKLSSITATRQRGEQVSLNLHIDSDVLFKVIHICISHSSQTVFLS